MKKETSYNPLQKRTIEINVKAIIMSVLKVIEILGNSTESFEKAIENIVLEASKTVRDIKSVYIQDMQVTINNNEIAEYRVNAKVTFGIQEA